MYVNLRFILVFRLCPWSQIIYIYIYIYSIARITIYTVMLPTWILTPSDLSFHPTYMQEHNCNCNTVYTG